MGKANNFNSKGMKTRIFEANYLSVVIHNMEIEIDNGELWDKVLSVTIIQDKKKWVATVLLKL